MVYQGKRTVYICSKKYKDFIVEYKNSRNRLKQVPETVYVYNSTKYGVIKYTKLFNLWNQKKNIQMVENNFFYIIDKCINNTSIFLYAQNDNKNKYFYSKML